MVKSSAAPNIRPAGIFQSKNLDPPPGKSNIISTACPPRKNYHPSSAVASIAKADASKKESRRPGGTGLQAKTKSRGAGNSSLPATAAVGQQAALFFPHLENVDSNVIDIGAAAAVSSSNASTPCNSPLKSNCKTQIACTNAGLPFSSIQVDGGHQGPSSTGGYGGFLSRTSSNVSSLTTTSGDDVEVASIASTSGSEAENPHVSGFHPTQSSRRKEQRVTTRRTSLGSPKVESQELHFEFKQAVVTPPPLQKPSSSRLAAAAQGRKQPGSSGTTPSPSPAAAQGSLRSGVQRALVLQHLSQGPSCFELEENPSFWDDHNVQVVVRTRPISSKEAADAAAKQDLSSGSSRCLRQEGASAITWLGQPETRFTFDHVAGENISQEKLFKVVGLPIVENCISGYNSCMFAYGQTGSGKTHTMLGDISSDPGDRPNDNRGMTPRIFEYLFSRIQKEEQDRQLEQLRYVCKCSFLEIYNEQITDLLEPSSSNLQMREDSKKGVYVENLTEKIVTNVQDVLLLLLKGAANRKVASTNMNRESSRSHSVFTCSVECKWETNSLSNMRFGRLNLVDLAGSERQKSSGAEGDRLKEAASINKSLSTLGLVIMILVDIANGKQRHVPYRDSKLTFLLQDSLGGNSKTAIIATISPSSCCSMETLSTLKFAQRAKFIQNNAVVNEDASGEMLALRREIQQLKEEVSRLRCQSITNLRRECRRDSNDFFRLSLTAKDPLLFDEKERVTDDEHSEDGLKSVELLEKIKALEAVLAGALRREQVLDEATQHLTSEIEKANKLIEEQEIEVRGCKSLLHDLHADEGDKQPSSDSGKQALSWATEKLESAERLEYNRTETKLELENSRLTEKLHCYRAFFDDGEKETMAAEIQGLRDQVLELLDGKIAVERGNLSTSTCAQGDIHRMELETCRNDLTNCLEASSQLQRQMNELQSLVNQLTKDCAEKDEEVDRMKGSCGRSEFRNSELEIEKILHLKEITALETRLQEAQEGAKTSATSRAGLEQEFHNSVQEVERLRAEIQELEEKCETIAKLKEAEFATLQMGWIAASAKLYDDLAEGERTLVELGQEMDEIMAADWLPQGETLTWLHDSTLNPGNPKSIQENAWLHETLNPKSDTRWSLGSGNSCKDVDTEQDYFKCRSNSFNTEELMFLKPKSTSKRTSSGFGVISPKTLKLQENIAHLEQELEHHKQGLEHAQKEKAKLQEEIELNATNAALKSSEILEGENVSLKVEVQQLREKMLATEQAIQAGIQANHKLENEVKVLTQELASMTVMKEELHTKNSSLNLDLENGTQRIEELDLRINELEASLEEKREENAASISKFEALQNELLSVTRSFQLSQDEVSEFKVKEAGLHVDLLGLKEQLSRSEICVDVTRGAEARLQEEIAVLLETLRNEKLEREGLKEELQALVSQHQTYVVSAEQKTESDVQTIRDLNETVEQLQIELRRKEDLLYGLEFDLSLLQEHAAEDTDFKQELLKANDRIFELEAEVQTRCEELKQLISSRKDLEDLLALKTNAMKQVEDDFQKSQTLVSSLLTIESQAALNSNSRISQLQTRASALEAELAGKSESLDSLAKELLAAREIDRLVVDLKSQCFNLVQKVDFLQESMAQQVAQVDASHGELLVTVITELMEAALQKGEVENEAKIARETLKMMQNQNQGFTRKISDCQESNKVLNLELSERISELASLQSEYSSTEDHQKLMIKNSRVEMRALLEERDGLQTSVDERASKISFLESELIQAQNSMQLLRSKITKDSKKVTDGIFGENSALQAQSVSPKQGLDSTLEMAENWACTSDEISTLQCHKCCALEPGAGAIKAQQEEPLRSLEEQLDRETLQLTTGNTLALIKPNINGITEVQCDHDLMVSCRKMNESKEQEKQVDSEEVEKRFTKLEEARDQALGEVLGLRAELGSAQSVVASLEASVLGKEEELSKLEGLISTLKNHNIALEKQLAATKAEVENGRQDWDELAMELQGMKNRMAMLQAVHSTGSTRTDANKAAQATTLDLQRRLEERETEVSQLYKRMGTLHSEIEAQESRCQDMETELAHVHQELDDLHRKCQDKDAQLSTLKELNKEAEKLTRDVMRDLHTMKLDIGNYALLVNQQQLELASERSRHSEEVTEKEEEISSLQTQLNEERQTWMVEMNHKQAEMVVARVLSEKMRLKNKTLSAECKKLKADCSGKKKKLKLLEHQLKELTNTDKRRDSIISMESDADFDEVQQFQALLAQANNHELKFQRQS